MTKFAVPAAPAAAPAAAPTAAAPDATAVDEGAGGGVQDLVTKAVELLREADSHPFASPEYDAGVTAALPVLLEVADAIAQNPDSVSDELAQMVARSIRSLQIYLSSTGWDRTKALQEEIQAKTDGTLPPIGGGEDEEPLAARARQFAAIDSPAQIAAKGRWGGIIGVEGERTGDGRIIQPGALRWAEDLADNPIPLRYVSSDVGAHDGAVVVGLVDHIERREGGAIWGEGPFDLGSETGKEAYRQVQGKFTNGVSMDLDDVSFEVEVPVEMSDDGEAPSADALLEQMMGSETMSTTDARVRAVTIVAIPAFATARIFALDGPEDLDENPDVVEGYDALVASAAPVAPPESWFRVMEANGPTPITVTDDGQVYGHLATWDVCHIASPNGAGVCVVAPKSRRGYSDFHTGTLKTKEGTILSTGRLTLDTRHAGPKLNAVSAAAHYDHTGKAVADVRATDGKYGIWISGALRPGVSEETKRVLRASPLSGDWRSIGGSLELVAALAVNVPGFPIPRPSGLVASITPMDFSDDGELMSLVAAGMIAPRRVIRPGTPGALSSGDLKYLKQLANRERAIESESLAGRVAKVKLAQDAKAKAAKVAAFAAKIKGPAAPKGSDD